MITYALAINANGTIKGIEIITYQESYGYEVAEAALLWQAVFTSISTKVPSRGRIAFISCLSQGFA